MNPATWATEYPAMVRGAIVLPTGGFAMVCGAVVVPASGFAVVPGGLALLPLPAGGIAVVPEAAVIAG